MHGGTSSVINLNTALLAQTDDWRVEFQVHTGVGGTAPTITYPYANVNGWFADNGTGIQFDTVSNLGVSFLQITDVRDVAVPGPSSPLCQVQLSANSVVRLQRFFVAKGSVPAQTFTAEAWNIDGTNYSVCTQPFTTKSWSFSGGGINSGSPVNLGFYRIFKGNCPGSTCPTVALNSVRPTTADGSSYLECKLDNTLSPPFSGNLFHPKHRNGGFLRDSRSISLRNDTDSRRSILDDRDEFPRGRPYGESTGFHRLDIRSASVQRGDLFSSGYIL